MRERPVVIVLMTALLSFVVALGAVPIVHAATIAVDSSWGSGPGSSWDTGTSRCTVMCCRGVASGDTLEVPSGTSLVINNSVSGIAGITVGNGASLTGNAITAGSGCPSGHQHG